MLAIALRFVKWFPDDVVILLFSGELVAVLSMLAGTVKNRKREEGLHENVIS